MRLRTVVSILLIQLIFAVCVCNAECKPTGLTELQSGVYELNLGDVRIKVEVYNNLYKMKLVGAVNEDWTSVSTEQGPGLISGYVGNGESAKLKAQSLLVINNGNFSLSVFRKNNLDDDDGVGYFVTSEGMKCIDSTYSKWDATRQKYFSNIASTSAINLEPDGFS
jgi:hypothetical protein